MSEQKTCQFAVGDRVETAHGAHSGLETGTIAALPIEVRMGLENTDPNGAEWYQVKMDCGCCTYSFDWRADGHGRIRAAR